MYFIEAVLHIRTRMSLGRAIYCEATYYGIPYLKNIGVLWRASLHYARRGVPPFIFGRADSVRMILSPGWVAAYTIR